MKILTLVVCLGMLLNGCGSAGSRLTTNNVMMEGGQWEYAVVPEDGAIPIFIEVNLPGPSVEVVATNAQFFQPSVTMFQSNRAQSTAATSTSTETSAVAL